MSSTNYLTAQDLGDVKSLVTTLDQVLDKADFKADIDLIDSNGESIGQIKWQEGEEGYVYIPLNG